MHNESVNLVPPGNPFSYVTSPGLLERGPECLAGYLDRAEQRRCSLKREIRPLTLSEKVILTNLSQYLDDHDMRWFWMEELPSYPSPLGMPVLRGLKRRKRTITLTSILFPSSLYHLEDGPGLGRVRTRFFRPSNFPSFLVTSSLSEWALTLENKEEQYQLFFWPDHEAVQFLGYFLQLLTEIH